MACLRIAINGQPTLYAVFIDSQPPKVILLRLAVRFDDCAQDQYEPLPLHLLPKIAQPGLRARNDNGVLVADIDGSLPPAACEPPAPGVAALRDRCAVCQFGCALQPSTLTDVVG